MPSISAFSLVLSVVALIWCGVVTALVVGQKNFFTELGRGVTKKDLQSLLKQIAVSLQEASRQIQTMESRLTNLEKDGVKHLQKIGFVRFNPFNDTGGDQSFCLCLLDEQNNGIVITSLHSRESTRLYGKYIQANGLKKEDFSSEEWEAYTGASQS